MSNVAVVMNLSGRGVEMQFANEIMIQVFDDLWENRPKAMEDRDMNSFQVNK